MSAAPSALSVKSSGHYIRTLLLAWLAVIGVDLAMNAGILGPFLDWKHPGLLPAKRMFQLIPVGYASFLLTAVLIFWLMLRLNVRGGKEGAKFGAKLGALVAAAGFLANLSILAIPAKTLLLWALDGVLYSIVTGAVVGSGIASARLKSLGWRVFMLVIGCILIAVVMQLLGLVPSTPLNGAHPAPGRAG